jgi:hypothetical protein
MSSIGHNFPPPDQLPIPQDVRPDRFWTEQMLEMAEHIGAYCTLLIVDRYGGEQLYIPVDPSKSKLRDLIGAEAAATMSHVYGREVLQIPTAKHALARARRQAIIASVKAGDMSGGDAARILRTSRSYLAFLVNQSDEAAEGEDRRPSRGHPGQLHLFGDEDG